MNQELLRVRFFIAELIYIRVKGTQCLTILTIAVSEKNIRCILITREEKNGQFACFLRKRFFYVSGWDHRET